jgi:hypothetical protein
MSGLVPRPLQPIPLLPKPIRPRRLRPVQEPAHALPQMLIVRQCPRHHQPFDAPGQGPVVEPRVLEAESLGFGAGMAGLFVQDTVVFDAGGRGGRAEVGEPVEAVAVVEVGVEFGEGGADRSDLGEGMVRGVVSENVSLVLFDAEASVTFSPRASSSADDELDFFLDLRVDERRPAGLEEMASERAGREVEVAVVVLGEEKENEGRCVVGVGWVGEGSERGGCFRGGRGRTREGGVMRVLESFEGLGEAGSRHVVERFEETSDEG